MENKDLEKNLDRIAQYDSELSKRILMTNLEKANILIAQNPNGEYNLVYNNCYLHSNKSIPNEIDEIVAKIGERNNQNVIRVVYGLGLGYLGDKVSELTGKTIIYEPNLEILKFVLSIARIDAIFKDNVYVCADKATLSNLVLENSNSETKMTINFLPSYFALYGKDIQETIKTMQLAKGGHNATKNTLLQMSPKAIRNTFYNLKKLVKTPNIMQLKDVYKDKTAICLSAGPSLRENIEIIKNNQDKFVIFAVNPTIRLLSEFGVEPDFIVDIETSNTSVQFSTIDTKNYYFITEAFTSYVIYNLETKNTFNYISKENFVNPWIRSSLKFDADLDTLGTVSYTAFISAYLMGFKKIILCGQDLAYKDGKCYAQGSQYEDLECVFDESLNKYVIKPKDFKRYAERLKTGATLKPEEYEEHARRHLQFLNNNIFTVMSQEGKQIPTQTGYAIFIDWFKQAARKIKAENPDIELINSSTGGAMIDGFENRPLDSFINDLETVEKLDLTGYKPNYDIEYFNQRAKLLLEKMKLYKSVLKELIEHSNRLLKEIKIKKIFTSNILKMIKKQDDLIVELVNAKKDEDIKPIIFFSLCKYSDALADNCYENPEKAKATTEEVIKISTEADKIYDVVLKNLANC